MRADPLRAGPEGEDPRWPSGAGEQLILARELPPVRPVVAASWQRCAGAGLSSDGSPAPVRLAGDGLAESRAGHPLAALLPMFRELLGAQAGGGGYVFAITDATGTLLWVEGDAATRRRAERMNFAPGAGWSEADAGTNALGTVLATLRPVQIVAAEHYNALVRQWSCAAAPVRDPVTGRVLGVLDITGGDGVASPHALTLVRATARLAETELARLDASDRARLRWQATPGPLRPSAGPASLDRRPPPAGAIKLTALGRDCALVEADGRVVRLRPRHSEIAVILALAAAGLPGPRLAVRLSETEIQPVTLRAEMSRLRTLLGADLIGSHPYEFRRPVSSDLAAVEGLLEQGQVTAALAAYPGPLLPSSQAPAIVERRAAVEQQLRAEVLASGDAGLLRHWVNATWGADDIPAWQALARALPAGSPQRSAAAARARALDSEIAAPLPRSAAAAAAVPRGVTLITQPAARFHAAGGPRATVRQRSRS